MPIRIHRAVLPALLLAGLPACAPSDSLEGKYYNEVGHFVMELHNGKVTMAPGMEYMNADYEVRGDTILLREPGGTGQIGVLLRLQDGSINAGLLGDLKKK